GALKFKYNLIATTSGVNPKTVETTTANVNVNGAWYVSQPNDSLNSSNGILVTPWNYTSPDYRPVASNTVTGGANFGDPALQAGGILSVNSLEDFSKQIGVYPNPNNGEATVIIHALQPFNVTVKIYSITGQLLSLPYENHTIVEGVNSLPVTADLASGIYFVAISNGTKTETIKMVVNK
ncbi:MAG: T9SS type A sorting domain-containing protein, partial [Bacteroidia bacterium]|nr:T9SS type A sorting domain-containing protein [Bacteroidia bacterium]